MNNFYAHILKVVPCNWRQYFYVLLLSTWDPTSQQVFDYHSIPLGVYKQLQKGAFSMPIYFK